MVANNFLKKYNNKGYTYENVQIKQIARASLS